MRAVVRGLLGILPLELLQFEAGCHNRVVLTHRCRLRFDRLRLSGCTQSGAHGIKQGGLISIKIAARLDGLKGFKQRITINTDSGRCDLSHGGEP
jgi:hypothetical protein